MNRKPEFIYKHFHKIEFIFNICFIVIILSAMVNFVYGVWLLFRPENQFVLTSISINENVLIFVYQLKGLMGKCLVDY